MAESSLIEWTDATWNPITGCSVLSPGCTNCYAMRLAGSRLQAHPSRAGLTTMTKAGPVWTGEVRLNADWLNQPLAWRRPRRIFVCAHGDLFHESVPDHWIDQVFAVMALAPRHTFQVLTKRAARMRAYIAGDGLHARLAERVMQLMHPNERLSDTQAGVAWIAPSGPAWGVIRAVQGLKASVRPWPLPNVWLGVSAEDQPRADERLLHLLATPAAVRFLSAEPLLGSMDIAWALSRPIEIASGFLKRGQFSPGLETLRRLDWVIAGGESGQAARPMHPDWVRQIRDDCAAGGVPFFFKQWGAWAPVCAIPDTEAYYDPAPEQRPEATRRCKVATDTLQLDGSRGDRFDYRPGAMMVMRIGKKAAGRLLDGREHNDLPREIA
jgi:protein gp37